MTDERDSQQGSAWAPPGSQDEPMTEDHPAVGTDPGEGSAAELTEEPVEEVPVEPVAAEAAAAVPAQPTPVIPVSESSFQQPPGSAVLEAAAAGPPPSSSPADRPELLAGAAFAGGFLVAMALKRLGH